MMKNLRIALALVLLCGPAAAQQGAQLPAGAVLGNPTAARAPSQPATLTAIIDRAFSAVQGSVITRNSTQWLALAPGTAGLPLLSGGAGANLAYGILPLTAGGTGSNLTATTARQMLQTTAGQASAWSTTTWPATSTINRILYSSAANVIGEIASANNSVLVTGGTGIPAFAATLPCVNFPALTGDVTTVAGACAATFATVNSNVGTFGGVSTVPVITVNGKGLITAVTTAAVTGAVGSMPITGGTDQYLLYNNAGVLGNRTIASVLTAGNGILVTGTTNAGLAVDKATAANYYAATANKVPTTDVIYPSGVAVAYGVTTTFDMNTFINATVTLTGNITTVTFTNIKAGQAGMIYFQQDGTGNRTLPASFNTNFKFSGGVQPVLSTAPGAVDILFYSCLTTTYCVASLSKAFS